MLSGAINLEADDIVAPVVPFVEDPVVDCDNLLKHMRSDSDLVASGVDENVPSPKFDLGWLFAEIAWSQVPRSPRLKATERFGIGDLTSVKVKQVTALSAVNQFCFRRTVAAFPSPGAAS